MTSDLATRLGPLPPDGLDLRAELDALRVLRVRQALEQTGGDLVGAARLLRMNRLELMRLESKAAIASVDKVFDGVDRLAETVRPPARARKRRVLAAEAEQVGAFAPRISAGVQVVSAAAIRRLAAEGLAERRIADRLGCNPYLVERVLRRDVENAVRRLDGEGLSAREIAARLKLPFQRVCRMLARDDLAGGKR